MLLGPHPRQNSRLVWGTSEIIAITSVAPLRRCPTSPESVPHFSGIRRFGTGGVFTSRNRRHIPAIMLPPRFESIPDATRNWVHVPQIGSVHARVSNPFARRASAAARTPQPSDISPGSDIQRNEPPKLWRLLKHVPNFGVSAPDSPASRKVQDEPGNVFISLSTSNGPALTAWIPVRGRSDPPRTSDAA